MSDKTTKDFEAAFIAKFGFGRMFASANADADQMFNAAEWAWTQSRAALVVELPELVSEPSPRDYRVYGEYHAEAFARDKIAHDASAGILRICREALTKAGVTVK